MMAGPLPIGDPAPTDGRLPGHIRREAATFSAYLHVPFCRVRCGYCDFNTYTATELRGARQDDYATELLREVALAKTVLADAEIHAPLHSIFVGGGTPTLLPAGDLARMIGGVIDAFGLESGAEVTVEANPDTVTDALAHELASAGVTRVSIGMQSAVPHVLAALDRTHNPANVSRAVEIVRGAGLAVSLDVIYGAPGETLGDWAQTLDAVLALGPDHVSAYALIIEEGTKLARQIKRGEVPAPDDDVQADMYELVSERLESAGYEWYEISNFARDPGQRSRHNLAYWQGGNWWGFGPGAHSHVGGLRWWNVKHPAAYAGRVTEGLSPAAGREFIDSEASRVERILLESRVRDGLPLDILSPEARVRVAGLIADGLIEPTPALRGRIVLTLRGRLLADTVVHALTENVAMLR